MDLTLTKKRKGAILMSSTQKQKMATLENLARPQVAAEKPAESIEFTGQHLEAAFASCVNYHKKRLLDAFGPDQQLPPLPAGPPADRFLASEKRLRKISDILNRQDPQEIPPISEGINREFLVALADNLAWRGMDNSVLTQHLDEIEQVLKRAHDHRTARQTIGQAVDISGVKERGRVLKSIAIANSHFYRDFFDSGLATDLGLDSPTALRRFLSRSSLFGPQGEVVTSLAKGISLEIAVKRYLTGLLSQPGSAAAGEEAIVNFGYVEEDKQGGDIVVIRGDKILYIDLKNSRPDSEKTFTEREREKSFSLRDRGIVQRAIVWPETPTPVSEDSFRINDPALKMALQTLVLETR